MVWFAVIVCVGSAILLYIFREDLTYLQAVAFGARMPVGCVIVEVIGLLLLALAFVLAHFAGIGPY
jgi:hypothetical protein